MSILPRLAQPRPNLPKNYRPRSCLWLAIALDPLGRVRRNVFAPSTALVHPSFDLASKIFDDRVRFSKFAISVDHIQNSEPVFVCGSTYIGGSGSAAIDSETTEIQPLRQHLCRWI